MQIVQIEEPKSSEKNIQASAVGIDFGTTNSLVAYSQNGLVKVIRDESGSSTTPSVVSVTESGDLIVGRKALTIQANQNVVTIKSVKRIIGKSFSELQDTSDMKGYLQEGNKELRLSANGTSLSVTEVSKLILEKIKSVAENGLGTKVTEAVLTVPAYFDEAQRRIVKYSAELAGINVLRMINEPTAAALAYKLDKLNDGAYIVYDLGGGTFDVSLLKIYKGVVRVIAVGGDSRLGGDDIDYLIAQYVHGKCGQDFPVQDYLSMAEDIKVKLSEKDCVELDINNFTLSISREEFNSIANPIIEKTLDILFSTLEDAEFSKSSLLGIILVGGSTKSPIIKNKLKSKFAGVRIYDSMNPEEVVAIGASIHADNLTSPSNELLLDVTPLSLGVEIMGGLNERIIPRNSPIPTSVEKEFTTYEDGQFGLKLHIVQGEREMAEDCRSLAHLELLGIPPMKAGEPRIKVRFKLDADGLLVVTASEATTNIEQSVEVVPSYGLSVKEVENEIYSSINSAESDHGKKLFTESQIYAREVIKDTLSAIEVDKALLTDEEYNNIQSYIKNVEFALDKGDKSQIDDAVTILEKATNEFANSRIYKHINAKIKGSSMKSVNESTTKNHIKEEI